MKIPQKTLERKLLDSGYKQVVGVDEVGMGCLAGPVVVCAVSFDKKFFQKSHGHLRGVRDSKLLSPDQRERLAIKLMKEKDFKFKIVYCSSKTIDKLNIYQAAREAMRRAVKKLSVSSDQFSEKKLETRNCKLKTIVLIDGPGKISSLPESIHQVPVIKGDQKVFTIACASILAKVFRDKMMIRYAKKFPGYGFEKHKGYGTKEHLIQLTKLGPCAIHRQSFAPVAKLL